MTANRAAPSGDFDSPASHPVPTLVLVRSRTSYRFVKRLIDCTAAATGLILLSPMLVLTGLAVALTSRGPILFSQRRVGRDGQPFTIYKFRTMHASAPPAAYKMSSDDPLITRVGSTLRRSGLDELPQLWNVLIGEMSLIGPRPEIWEIAVEQGLISHPRHMVRPGITGWWQIHHRANSPLHHGISFDLYYLDQMSLVLDATIAWRTVKYMTKALLPALPPQRDVSIGS